jgi:hypothetical protein
MFSRFIYLVAYVKISFLSIAEYYSIMCISHILFIHSSVEEHLSCSDFLAIVNKAAMILGITDICSNFWIYRSGISGSCGKFYT